MVIFERLQSVKKNKIIPKYLVCTCSKVCLLLIFLFVLSLHLVNLLC